MILDEILANKRIELEESKKSLTINFLKDRINKNSKSKDFFNSLYSKKNEIKIIAEIKKASPSKGILKKDFNPAELAEIYAQSGASAISVLTDYKYFKGTLQDLLTVRNTVDIPLLRKDFIIDPYQVYESKYYGADAVLLIVAALGTELLKELKMLIQSLGMYPLVEVHDEEELQKALDLNCSIIGINNRDLKTFNVDLNTAIRLSKLIPDDKLIISESGISTPDNIRLLFEHGIKAFLVGESLVKSENVSTLLSNLLNSNM